MTDDDRVRSGGSRVPLSYRRQLARERHINQVLQHAIQPASSVVDDLAGLRVAVRYRSADPVLRIGGDWYLVRPLANGDLVMAVGDVAGHGLGAVETMVMLRYAMAAYAVEGHPPAMILSRLNALLIGAGVATTATAVVATFRPSTGQIVWATTPAHFWHSASPERSRRAGPQDHRGRWPWWVPGWSGQRQFSELPPGRRAVRLRSTEEASAAGGPRYPTTEPAQDANALGRSGAAPVGPADQVMVMSLHHM
ncbi:serine/threonine-protein phosphatase [Micromonospora sp. PLK6-60]|uniref:PP2C family protein-serine/threonine phosphatase n=1 Tax=Micromonospora sp. PLK6-60 TaxID=2873383 RepID=UPI001CA73ABC|nr:SpoIIE family protein phosphatase [Micromonospora sp. PLK6-60]MBY8870526.1 serine/threonine-protein phosphatase [Micromonospora sp. PLK6-60]